MRVPILLVDDEPGNIIALESILDSPGYELIRAGSGREALRVLLDRECALILLDIRMPVLDGLQTAAIIRRRALSRHTPIIFLTADDSPASVTRAYEEGAADFLVKPVNALALQAKVSVFAELFRQREHIRQQEAARREAEAASRAKDEFLATASHELRTPLNSILGWVQMLRSERLAPQERGRALEIIERNAKVQVQLIEDILDGSRIITGKLHLEPRRLDLNAVVSAALDAVRPAAVAKNITLTSSLDQEATWVVGDGDRLQQVVWNLASNAIKFTPKGGRVHVALERAGPDVQIKVVDSGQGIRREFLPLVFERFLQGEASNSRRHGGLGLGLALVRHLVEAHGGHVQAESQGEGTGSAFTITLPVGAVPASERVPVGRPVAETPELPHASASCLVNLAIVVVDDEPDARELVAAVFRSQGAVVTVAASADAALDALHRERPRVLVSDVAMPHRDGYELIRRVRALGDERVSGVLAVALTAYAREEDRRRALEAGFHAYASKPIEPAELVRVVARLVG